MPPCQTASTALYAASGSRERKGRKRNRTYIHVTTIIKKRQRNPYSVAVIDSVPLNGGGRFANEKVKKGRRQRDANESAQSSDCRYSKRSIKFD